MNDRVKADALLKMLVDHYLHQDKIIWEQIKTILSLQAGVLAGCYLFKGHYYTFIISFIGIIYTCIIYSFILKARLDRDINLRVIDELRSTCHPEITQILISKKDNPNLYFTSDLGQKTTKWDGFGLPYVRGYILIRVAVYFAIMIDIFASIILFNK